MLTPKYRGQWTLQLPFSLFVKGEWIHMWYSCLWTRFGTICRCATTAQW